MSEIVNITHLPKSNLKLGETGIEITSNAMEVLKNACKEENKTHLRIGVKGGGCSGFQYVLDFIEATDTDQEDDIMIWQGSFCIVVDTFSNEYLKGTIIDHVSTLKETGFKFENPNSKRTCGCGSSFSV